MGFLFGEWSLSKVFRTFLYEFGGAEFSVSGLIEFSLSYPYFSPPPPRSGVFVSELSVSEWAVSFLQDLNLGSLISL